MLIIFILLIKDALTGIHNILCCSQSVSLKFLNQLILLTWKRVHLVTVKCWRQLDLYVCMFKYGCACIYKAKRLSHRPKMLSNDDKWKTVTCSAGFWIWSDWPELSDLYESTGVTLDWLKSDSESVFVFENINQLLDPCQWHQTSNNIC